MTDEKSNKARPNVWQNVNATRIFVTVVGVCLALTGITHGIREILLGNTPTKGLLSAEIGAFTLIPNHLITGIAVVLVGTLIVIWTVCFIQTKRGPTVFLLMYILLTLVGGGIAQILILLIAWAISTRINKPLLWWQRILPEATRRSLGKSWVLLFIVSMSSILIGVLARISHT